MTPLVCIAGPTASGKSAIALELADLLPGEIVSVDSMQVYRGLNIGSAKPSAIDQARIPHHLIDVVEISESFDAAEFIHHATAACASIRTRGRTPILCGGTGFYFEAFFHGLSEMPASDAPLRALLESTPLGTLLEELAGRDPVAYERIDRHNPRRVIRAIEVIRLTGKPFSSFRRDWNPESLVCATREDRVQFVIDRHPFALVDRIHERIDSMFQQGLVEETRALLGKGLKSNRTAMQAIGYRQVVDFLEGSSTLAASMEEIRARTRQFAKRQRSWFRTRRDWQPFQVPSGESPTESASRIYDLVRRGS